MKAEAKLQRWYSQREVAQRYGVHPRSITRWVAARRFPPGTKYPNEHYYWPIELIEEHERSLVTASGAAR